MRNRLLGSLRVRGVFFSGEMNRTMRRLVRSTCLVHSPAQGWTFVMLNPYEVWHALYKYTLRYGCMQVYIRARTNEQVRTCLQLTCTYAHVSIRAAGIYFARQGQRGLCGSGLEPFIQP